MLNLREKLKLAKLSNQTISQEANIFATHSHRYSKQNYYYSYFFTITIPDNVDPDLVMQRFQIAAHKITKGRYDYVGMFCSTDLRKLRGGCNKTTSGEFTFSYNIIYKIQALPLYKYI